MPVRSQTTESPKKSTPSFVCEIPLRVSMAVERALSVRFEDARQVYNACLDEAKRRVTLIRQSKAYQQACKHSPNDPQRSVLFAQVRKQYDYSEYALHAYATTLRKTGPGARLDAKTGQKLASRAYQATNRLLLGQAKRVRFKGKNQMDSVEGKKGTVGIRWCSDRVEWMGLVLPARIDPKDLVMQHGLHCPIKYVRLVRRKIGEKNRWYAQLICEGTPYHKERHTVGVGIVGLDIGPQTIAIVSEQDASLQPFCPEVIPNAKMLRRLDRKIDRQRRANNPEHYDERGHVKAGKKRWNVSNQQRRTQALRHEYYRKLAATRKREHGTLVHQIMQRGNQIHLEKLSYKAWQKGHYGKSIGLCAPGLFVSLLSRAAASAHGRVVEINARRAKLSQTCHCGAMSKKPLSQRHHRCPCGVTAQRDLYSAFLAQCVDPTLSLLDAGRACAAWPSREPVLQAAFEQATINQPTSGRKSLPSSFGAGSRQRPSRSPAQGPQANVKSRDAVPVRQRAGRARKRQR